MVLGLRSKNRKGASVQVDYIIHLQQIKPWPPSQSLRSLRSVLLQWENGEKNSGSTNPVMPLLGSSAAEGKIEFNESFKLQVTFLREGSARGNDVFQKNVLEFNLYEPRRDKTIKGQHLGSAVIDLTEHGIIRDTVKVGVPVNCKRSFRNTVQPLLYLMIQPFENDSLSSSSRESLSKEASMDKEGRESVSALMSEEYAEEAEIASFTDDDVSSHSSLTMSSSAFEANADVPVQSSPGEQVGHENGSKAIDKRAMVTGGKELAPEYVPTEKDQKPSVAEYAHNADPIHQNGTSLDNLSTETVHLESDNASSSNFLQSPTPRPENSDKDSSHSSSFTEEATRSDFSKDGMERDDLVEAVQTKNKGFTGEENAVENPVNDETGVAKVSNSVEFSDVNLHDGEQNLVVGVEPEDNVADDGKLNLSRDESNEASSSIIVHDISGKGAFEEKLVKYASEEKTEAQNYEIEYERFAEIPPDSVVVVSLADKEHTPDSQQHNSVETGIQKPAASGTMKSNPNIFNGKNSSTMTSYRLKSRNFSVRSQPESHRVTGSAVNDKYMDDAKEIDVQEDVYSGGLHFDVDGDKDERERASGHLDRVKNACRYNRNGVSSNKLQELEHKVEMLESELMEAAAIEISLYSVVAEHVSSAHKVHTPARRLSRLYIHASRQWSRERMANAAKNIISGLVLAAKSCGNDVPRLTFWLSNSVVLRIIVMQEFGHQELPLSTGLSPVPNGGGIVPREKPSPLRWESTARKKEKASCTEASDDWEDPCTFITALERIEAWIFSRIIESIWWQTLTPHMQCPNEDGEKERVSNPKRIYKKQSSLGDQQQANKAIEIWKNAFADACERLCPVRAAGHECGCLPVLARLVMEQCVARLDVAMFNAILRESDDEIPTDPVADPISDSKVLPIPSGKLSFGAGAQLKNAIGNWSRWLTDLFGMDMDDSPQEEMEEDDRFDVAASLKSFHLLNALSDLLMLPKDMLLEASIRKEVCPTFSASIIRRILGSFSPDEFCPDAIPDAVLESLDSEDPPDTRDEGAKSSPCDASPIRYSPPSVALVQSIIGDVRLSRSGSSVVRKCHTSDDELEELESPLKSIVTDKSSPSITKSKGRTAPNAVRYQLLREVWRDYN